MGLSEGGRRVWGFISGFDEVVEREDSQSSPIRGNFGVIERPLLTPFPNLML